MEKFKVKKKHLTGEIAYFPKRVVQAMVDEQVRQGNPANPSVFARERTACKDYGGFTWTSSVLGCYLWSDIIRGKKFHLIPKREKKSLTSDIRVEPKREKPSLTIDIRVEPNAIIKNMLAKGMDVWACVSDKSYDDARANIGRYAYRVTRYSTDSCYPVWTWSAGWWKYAIPIDTATMTEITEVPK